MRCVQENNRQELNIFTAQNESSLSASFTCFSTPERNCHDYLQYMYVTWAIMKTQSVHYLQTNYWGNKDLLKTVSAQPSLCALNCFSSPRMLTFTNLLAKLANVLWPWTCLLCIHTVYLKFNLSQHWFRAGIKLLTWFTFKLFLFIWLQHSWVVSPTLGPPSKDLMTWLFLLFGKAV